MKQMNKTECGCNFYTSILRYTFLYMQYVYVNSDKKREKLSAHVLSKCHRIYTSIIIVKNLFIGALGFIKYCSLKITIKNE